MALQGNATGSNFLAVDGLGADGSDYSRHVWSVFCWAFLTGSGSNQTLLSLGSGATGNAMLKIDMSGTTVRARITGETSGLDSADAAAAAVTGEWWPVLATFDCRSAGTVGGTAQLAVYTRVATAAKSVSMNGLFIRRLALLRHANSNTGSFMAGTSVNIAHAAVWNRVLGTADWDMLQAGANPQEVAAPDLLLHLPLGHSDARDHGPTGRAAAMQASYAPVWTADPPVNPVRRELLGWLRSTEPPAPVVAGSPRRTRRGARRLYMPPEPAAVFHPSALPADLAPAAQPAWQEEEGEWLILA